MKIFFYIIGVTAIILVLGLLFKPSSFKEDKQQLSLDNGIYLDVRTDTEWDSGHLDQAIHFNVERLEKGEMPDLPLDSQIKVYCRSGRRAETARAILIKNGFTKIENVGAYEALRDGGQKVCIGKLAKCSK